MDEIPAFPPIGSMVSYRFAPAGTDYTYIDGENLYMGYTYNYRVFAIKDGRVILESNIASVYVDTSVIRSPRQ